MADEETGLVPTASAELAAGDPNLAAVLTVFNALDAVDDDPTPRMMRAIMEAPDPREWEKVFTAAHFKDSAGRRFILDHPRRAPSNYDNRFGKQYLVVDVVDPKGGEGTVMTISSEMAMVQLLACQARDWLPAEFEVVRKKEPTRNGFYPMRLSFIRQVPRVGGEAER